MSKKANPKRVGAFVLVAIALTIVAIVLFSSGQLFTKKFHFIVFFDGAVGGLNVGAPVKFRGVEIGAVSDVKIRIPGSAETATAVGVPVTFFIDETALVKRGGSARLLEDPDSVAFMISQGLRAKMQVESFVTGRRFIELDFLPQTPINLVNDPAARYPELPSAKTGLDIDAIQADVRRLLADLSGIELASTVISIKSTFDSLRMVISTPQIREALVALPDVVNGMTRTLARFELLAADLDTTVVPLRKSLLAASAQASETLAAAEASFLSVRELLDPESPLAVHLVRLMEEVAASARATRQLTEYLERNPSSLLRGKPEEKD